SLRASATSRIARSRSSGGYFLCAGMIIILSGFQTLHQTRGDSDFTRQISRLQIRLIELSQGKTEALSKTHQLNMTSLEASINRLQLSK
ncbi:hypothetical protein, partial [Flaviflexus huanghaiensis]|uniref:hypothetical protein n=1 Tax=Flaviflexus huanghaiensis TaxID=1111473 RepID=UPI0019D67717